MILCRLAFLMFLASQSATKVAWQTTATKVTEVQQRVHIRGTVVNGATHRPVVGVPVALEALHGAEPATVARGRAGAHGHFTLDAPPLAGAGGYAVVATYKGVPYAAGVDARQPTRPLTVSVYDTTSSDGALIAPLVQIGMTRTSHGLQVAEEWTVVNPTSLTDVGQDAVTGRGAAYLPVSSGASNVTVVPGTAPLAAPASIVPGAVSVDTVIRPATGRDTASFHQVKFAFTLPYGPDHPTLRIPTRYLIGSLEVFSLPPTTLNAPGFARATLGVGNDHTTGWRAQAIAPNTTTSIGVDGPPAPLIPPGPPPFPLASVAILAGGGFALLLALGLTGRVPSPSPALAGSMSQERAPAEGTNRLQRERARLVAAIAELDLQYARGRVPVSSYERRRAREKSRLLDIARRLGG